MKPLSFEAARELVAKQIEDYSDSPDCDHGGFVIGDNAIERHWGWVFFITTRKFQETGDFEHAIIGQGGFFVNKNDGSIHSTGSWLPPEAFIEEYETQLAAKVPNASPYRQPKRNIFNLIWQWLRQS